VTARREAAECAAFALLVLGAFVALFLSSPF
jgi:hypothetical protein